ncbi:MAG: hypothetical protein HAW67_02260 [Endozoicomonadaceae bacterium]|nr:hypothetical protein [Endozoicomonadaceae bacterium]
MLFKNLTEFDTLGGTLNLKELSDPLLLVNSSFRIPFLNPKTKKEQGTAVPFYLYCLAKARLILNDNKVVEDDYFIGSVDERYKNSSLYEKKTRELVKQILRSCFNAIETKALSYKEFLISQTVQRKLFEFAVFNESVLINSIDDIDTGSSTSIPFTANDIKSFTLPAYLALELNEICGGDLRKKALECATQIMGKITDMDFARIKEFTTFSRMVQNKAMYEIAKSEASELLEVELAMQPIRKTDKKRVREYARLMIEAKEKGIDREDFRASEQLIANEKGLNLWDYRAQLRGDSKKH